MFWATAAADLPARTVRLLSCPLISQSLPLAKVSGGLDYLTRGVG